MLTATTSRRTVALATGRLELIVEEAAWPLDALCAFAARDNARRGFLIVSRVLGRHLPTTPHLMRQSARDLAARVPDDLPGPVLVVGLAETAVCLGQTVHEELRARLAREDLWFVHSTRQEGDGTLLCRFEEPHSHAAAHLIYRPDCPAPRTLVIVDDEVSTGTTLGNLAEALVAVWPGIERMVVATLTDWSLGRDWPAQMPRPTAVAALLSGRLEWTPGGAAPTGRAAARGALGRMAVHRNFGRLGIAAPVDPAPSTALPKVAGPLRIVGTGEFTYPPFRLAERLAAAGHDVVVQATSRSPVKPGPAIARKLRFADNYGSGAPNYLYNAGAGDGRMTWIAHETPAGSVDPALVAALGATLVGWG